MHTTISKRSYSDLRKNTVSAAATATRALEFTSRLHESLFRVRFGSAPVSAARPLCARQRKQFASRGWPADP
jgi:hypothetical protein